MFVGVVAYGDDEIVSADDIADVCGAWPSQTQAMSVRGRDGPRMHSISGLRAGRGRRNRAAALPQRGRQLGTRRIVRTDEHHPQGGERPRAGRARQHVRTKSHIGAAGITLRTTPLNQPSILQYATDRDETAYGPRGGSACVCADVSRAARPRSVSGRSHRSGGQGPTSGTTGSATGNDKPNPHDDVDDADCSER